ncbi:large ribosomal subunit protein mL54 [Cryptomeria japonica]|uniref:large ribosomal subunit protein mL54 n=1 Tax=Cryptomeria japonica TaxID=3369 RepID=UPI0025AD7F55|nr:large ribosomal subunit protein mL54 [Cryptomeria japonica]
MKASIWKIGSALLRPTIFSTYRSFAAKAKKGGGKGGGAAAPAAPTISKEVKATTVYGANILKDGVDPPIKPDSEYPDWLWHLLDKHPPLSELQRKNPSTMTLVELQRFVKLDNRRRIKENNALRAKH